MCGRAARSMLPSLALLDLDNGFDTESKHARAARRPRVGPYDRVAPRDVDRSRSSSPGAVLMQLPHDERLAEEYIQRKWKELIGFDPTGRKIWNTIEPYGTDTLHKQLLLTTQKESLRELNGLFPLDEVTLVNSVVHLFRWESHIVLSMLFPDLLQVRGAMNNDEPPGTCGSQYLWMFSCHPEWNEGNIQVLRAEPNTRWSTTFETSTIDLVKNVETAFAFKEHLQTCGSFNCVVPNINVPSTTELLGEVPSLQTTRDHQSMMAGHVIKKFQPLGTTASPSTATARAPKYMRPHEDPDAVYEDMVKETSELFLTLHMAQTRITPPVYAAVPVFERESFGGEETKYADLKMTRRFGFAYLCEGNWTSLSKILREPIIIAEEMLSSAILACVRNASNNAVLLLDVKSPNMIAKRSMDSTGWDVRMIDFGSAFSVNIDRFGKPSGHATTSSDCVFFVNGLLLLNSAYYPHTRKRRVFSELLVEVVATWRTMKALGKIGGFCAYLARDKAYAQTLRRSDPQEPIFSEQNLTVLKEEAFFKELSRVFYTTLRGYGQRVGGTMGVHANENGPPAWLRTSYVERILNELTQSDDSLNSWWDSSTDKIVQDRIDAMTKERSQEVAFSELRRF